MSRSSPPILNSGQSQMMGLIRDLLLDEGLAVVQAGTRSGKTQIAATIIRDWAGHVLVLSSDSDITCSRYSGMVTERSARTWTFSDYHRVGRRMVATLGPPDLMVMEEPYRSKKSFRAFSRLIMSRSRCAVLAVGTPVMRRDRWTPWVNVRFATWDVFPGMSCERRLNFVRDLGAFTDEYPSSITREEENE